MVERDWLKRRRRVKRRDIYTTGRNGVQRGIGQEISIGEYNLKGKLINYHRNLCLLIINIQLVSQLFITYSKLKLF